MPGVRTWPNGSATAPIVTAEFGGTHPLTGIHRGIDLVGYEWNRAADDGRVIVAGENGTAGFEVKILHEDGYFTRYLHNEPSLLVRVGQRVNRGDRLGKLGDTGFVTGRHCHFEVIAPDGTTRINPREYITAGVPASTDSTPFTTTQEDDMRVLVRPGGDCFMVTTKPRIKHLGSAADLAAAEKTFGKRIECTETEFRVALIGLGIPYSKAVKGADWQG